MSLRKLTLAACVALGSLMVASNTATEVDLVRKSGIAVGDRFTVLNRGKTLGTAVRGEIAPEDLQNLMAGGQELAFLECSLGGTV